MIYLFYIVNPAGILIWSYRYSRLPKELIKHLAKYGEDNFDSILSSAVRALWIVGKEISGIDLKEVDYGPFYLYMMSRVLDGKDLLFIMLADSKDNPKLLKRILEEFIEKNKNYIVSLVTEKEKIAEADEKEIARLSMELESSLTDIINDHRGAFEVTARKDFASLIMSFFSGLFVYGIVLMLTYLLNKAYHFLPRQEFVTFFAIVILLDFLFPSLIIGFFAGSFRNAVISSLVIGPIVIGTLSLIWWDDVLWMSEYFFKITNVAIIAAGIILAGFVVGAALGILAGVMAYFVSETRWLVPSKEYIAVKESKKEQFKLGVISAIEAIKKSVKRLIKREKK